MRRRSRPTAISDLSLRVCSARLAGLVSALLCAAPVAKEPTMTLDRLLGPMAADRSLLSAFLDQIPAGVVVFDHGGRPLLHNAAFTEIVGAVPPLVQEVALDCDKEARPAPVTRALAGEAVMGDELQ